MGRPKGATLRGSWGRARRPGMGRPKGATLRGSGGQSPTRWSSRGWTEPPRVVIIAPMSDDKPKPVDDLKEGLNLLFRAAKGAVEKLPTNKLEDVAKDAAKEVGRAFESLGNELDKAFKG